MRINLTDRVAVVTGATGELGRIMAITLAKCGASVAIHYFQNERRARQLLESIKELGRPAVAVQADVTRLDSVLSMRDRIRDVIGDPDILVNNALIQNKWLSVMELAEEDYETQYRSSILHNVFMAKAFVPAMIKKGFGRIIATNTECAMRNEPGMSAYSSGKRGMDGVLRVLAKEVGPHQITVNQIAPGWTISEKDRLAGTEQQEGYEKNVPLRRRGQDQEIANVVAFLASDLASFVTGAWIPVCGGAVMPGI